MLNLQKYFCIIFAMLLAGCVERTVTITSAPKDSLVWLNDLEVGRTPVKVPFEWYGDYDIVIRKKGYDTLKTHKKLIRPWYQYIPIDLISETLIPATIHDDHYWDFTLTPSKPADKTALLKRAMEMRDKSSGKQTPEKAK